jgi:hypothetical protein
MTRLKARIMVIVAAAVVGAVSVPFAVANKGADDPAGHVRHAKKHDKKAANKKGKKGTKAQKGQKGNAGTTSKGREAEPGDDRGRQAEPGDDRGQAAEPGDDRGGHGNDDGSGHN